jgi:hypothetical protein
MLRRKLLIRIGLLVACFVVGFARIDADVYHAGTVLGRMLKNCVCFRS